MKVIERRNITSKVDGEYLLQMEDWSEDYPSVHAYADQLAAYPIAKGSVYKGNYSYPRRGEKFRLSVFVPSSRAFIAFCACAVLVNFIPRRNFSPRRG